MQISEAGPPHQRIYIWQGEFFGMTAQGQGRSKKEARIAAAKAIGDVVRTCLGPKAMLKGTPIHM